MKIDPTLLIFCAAVILSGMFMTGISLRGQVYAQGTEVDVEKLKKY
jgi:hypothetical protein